MTKTTKRILLLSLAALLLASCATDRRKPKPGLAAKPIRQPPSRNQARALPEPPILPAPGQRTVDDVLYHFGPYAVQQLKPYFQKSGVDYPPREITLLALKEEKRLELWARGQDRYRFIRDYAIKAASGKPGPKLRQGDRQVPEGIYRVVGLNPNSHYHLSLRLDYPNDFDLLQAQREGRVDPGSDIFIHGKEVSAGCLAMGDLAIEELFVLAAQVGRENIKIVIAPHDPKTRPLEPDARDLPVWTRDLYQAIAGEIDLLSAPVRVSNYPQ
jgi:hypothetical protein